MRRCRSGSFHLFRRSSTFASSSCTVTKFVWHCIEQVACELLQHTQVYALAVPLEPCQCATLEPGAKQCAKTTPRAGSLSGE